MNAEVSRLSIMFLFLLFGSPALNETAIAQISTNEGWCFVSVPDFLNKDTEFPQPGFEDHLAYFLGTIKKEDPEFLLVPGDLINGRWPSLLKPTPDAIVSSAEIYYEAWKKRMDYHGLNYYAALGDHEIGDNPWPPCKAELVPLFKEQFIKYLKPPLNGPSEFSGTSYYWTEDNVLFISLDVFNKSEDPEAGIVADVTGDHLKWIESVFRENQNAIFKIVMGHTPILDPVKKMHSSGIMLEKGADSELWKVLRQNGVDLYLCGEVHAITCLEDNGTHQVAHGSLFGWNPTVNYLLVEIFGNRLNCTLKEIDIIPIREGRKSLGITITENSRKEGFRNVGTLSIEKASDKTRTVKSGCFAPDSN